MSIQLVQVDDLGWNDVAGFAGNDTNIHMPNLQQYVREGVELRNFHTFRFCSPTRSSLMTARYPYHMGQQTNMNLNPAATIACGIPLNYSFLPELLQQKAPEENKPRSLFLGKVRIQVEEPLDPCCRRSECQLRFGPV